MRLHSQRRSNEMNRKVVNGKIHFRPVEPTQINMDSLLAREMMTIVASCGSADGKNVHENEHK